MRRSCCAILMVFVMLLVAACGGDNSGGTEPGTKVASVVLSDNFLIIDVGDVVIVSAQARDAAGAIIADAAISWLVSDTALVSVRAVDATRASVLGRAKGLVTVTAKAGDRVSAPLSVSVSRGPQAFIWSADGGMIALPDFGSSNAVAINSAGDVVGYGRNASGDTHALLWQKGSVVDLGILPGFVSSFATSINNIGEIVGGVVGSGSPNAQAVHWAKNDSGQLKLGPLPTAAGSTAVSINNLGWIVGSDFIGGAFRPYLLKPADFERALPGTDQTATVTAINDSGTVAGSVQNGNSSLPMVWTRDGTAVSLSAALSGSGTASAINALGQATGESGARAFLWDSKVVVRDLGSLGAGSASGAGVNNRGQVVGSSATTSGRLHAFVWTPGASMRDIGVLPGRTQSWAAAINDAGTVVGWSR